MHRPTITRVVEEFLLINLPIAIYVLIEAHHRSEDMWQGFLSSTEWCIGTAVMSFQGVRLYLYGTADGPRKSPAAILLLFLIATLVTAAAFYLLSMHQHTAANSALKWTLFIIATCFFSLSGGAGLWGEREYRRREG